MQLGLICPGPGLLHFGIAEHRRTIGWYGILPISRARHHHQRCRLHPRREVSSEASERAQAALLQRLNKTSNTLSAIASRLPGGEAYAAVKQAERRAEQRQESQQ